MALITSPSLNNAIGIITDAMMDAGKLRRKISRHGRGRHLGDGAGDSLWEVAGDPAQAAARQDQGEDQIFRAQLNPQTPTLIKAKLFENLGKTLDLYTDRPGFVVLKLSSRESFGFFNFEYSENYIFCLMDSEGKPTNFLANVSIALSVPVSIAEPTLLILGKLDSYSQVEKVPVWPQ